MSIEEIKGGLSVEQATALINNNECKVKQLAEQLGARQSDVRAVLNEYFGDRIMFCRGRKGGVRWNVVQNNQL